MYFDFTKTQQASLVPDRLELQSRRGKNEKKAHPRKNLHAEAELMYTTVMITWIRNLRDRLMLIINT